MRASLKSRIKNSEPNKHKVEVTKTKGRFEANWTATPPTSNAAGAFVLSHPPAIVPRNAPLAFTPLLTATAPALA